MKIEIPAEQALQVAHSLMIAIGSHTSISDNQYLYRDNMFSKIYNHKFIPCSVSVANATEVSVKFFNHIVRSLWEAYPEVEKLIEENALD